MAGTINVNGQNNEGQRYFTIPDAETRDARVNEIYANAGENFFPIQEIVNEFVREAIAGNDGQIAREDMNVAARGMFHPVGNDARNEVLEDYQRIVRHTMLNQDDVDTLSPSPWMLPLGFGRSARIEDKRVGFEVVNDENTKFPNVATKTPRRADVGSAGYDFYSKETVSIEPGKKHLFWTDIKAYMESSNVLKIYIRSSLAVNRDLVLANQVGIVDKSYYNNPSNDGNIGICIRNMSDEVQHITCDERIAQGIFEDYDTVDNDEAIILEHEGHNAEREGGFGSTGTL